MKKPVCAKRIGELRREVDAVDSNLLRGIARRCRIVAEIRKARGVPFGDGGRDARRERAIVRRLTLVGEFLGDGNDVLARVPPKLVEAVWNAFFANAWRIR